MKGEKQGHERQYIAFFTVFKIILFLYHICTRQQCKLALLTVYVHGKNMRSCKLDKTFSFFTWKKSDPASSGPEK